MLGIVAAQQPRSPRSDRNSPRKRRADRVAQSLRPRQGEIVVGRKIHARSRLESPQTRLLVDRAEVLTMLAPKRSRVG
jgi:hypothetical protein